MCFVTVRWFYSRFFGRCNLQESSCAAENLGIYFRLDANVCDVVIGWYWPIEGVELGIPKNLWKSLWEKNRVEGYLATSATNPGWASVILERFHRGGFTPRWSGRTPAASAPHWRGTAGCWSGISTGRSGISTGWSGASSRSAWSWRNVNDIARRLQRLHANDGRRYDIGERHRRR